MAVTHRATGVTAELVRHSISLTHVSSFPHSVPLNMDLSLEERPLLGTGLAGAQGGGLLTI